MMMKFPPGKSHPPRHAKPSFSMSNMQQTHVNPFLLAGSSNFNGNAPLSSQMTPHFPDNNMMQQFQLFRAFCGQQQMGSYSTGMMPSTVCVQLLLPAGLPPPAPPLPTGLPPQVSAAASAADADNDAGTTAMSATNTAASADKPLAAFRIPKNVFGDNKSTKQPSSVLGCGVKITKEQIVDLLQDHYETISNDEDVMDAFVKTNEQRKAATAATDSSSVSKKRKRDDEGDQS